MTLGWRLVAACGAALAAILALVIWRSLHLTGGWLLALQITAALAVLGLLAAAWLAVLAATATTAAPDGATAPDGDRRQLLLRVSAGEQGPVTEVLQPTPAHAPGLRRAMLVAIVAAAPVLVVLALAAPAGARPSAAPPPPTAADSAPTAAASLTPSATGSASRSPAPSPTAPAPTTPVPAPPAAAADSCQVEVGSGDTLWGLAAARLGEGADLAQVDAAWRADYAANRSVVGADPDLIHPGQVLALPCS